VLDFGWISTERAEALKPVVFLDRHLLVNRHLRETIALRFIKNNSRT